MLALRVRPRRYPGHASKSGWYELDSRPSGDDGAMGLVSEPPVNSVIYHRDDSKDEYFLKYRGKASRRQRYMHLLSGKTPRTRLRRLRSRAFFPSMQFTCTCTCTSTLTHRLLGLCYDYLRDIGTADVECVASIPKNIDTQCWWAELMA